MLFLQPLGINTVNPRYNATLSTLIYFVISEMISIITLQADQKPHLYSRIILYMLQSSHAKYMRTNHNGKYGCRNVYLVMTAKHSN